MSEAEVDDYLALRHTAAMCTMNPDATIHAVATYYGFLHGALAVHTHVKSQKIRNLERTPTLTMLIESGESYESLRGVEIVGRAELVRDPAELFALGVSVHERYIGPYDASQRDALIAELHNRVGVVLHPQRVISWDHRKLTPSDIS